jgi:molybdopterin-guanine dinucleotide biosynthesis protein A
MKSMIRNLKKINYISTEILRQWDPKLQTFINVNTPEELKKITNSLLNP